MTNEIRNVPRGSIDWSNYARRQISRSRFLDVPCRFPDLRDDRQLKAAIRFTIEKQLISLQEQIGRGIFVFSLMEYCHRLLDKVRDTTPNAPNAAMLQAWVQAALSGETFRAGIQAIEWTVQERGLAGPSDLQGLSWVMSIGEFFEAWAETVLAAVARKIGGVLRTGRQRQTVMPLSWDPPYAGSQKSLVPDLVLEREHQTIIVDAKYKEHWEEMQRNRWTNLDEEVRERHREDILQVLAYANLSNKARTTVCLAYPCEEATWESLRKRNMLFNRASIGVGTRQVDLVLTALPISTRLLGDAVDFMAREFSRVHS